MRSYEKITQKHVIEAQQQWAHAIVTMDIDCLMSLYDYNCSDTPALFKPTLSSSIRSDAVGARSYFIGGNTQYSEDTGFLNNNWKQVNFFSAVGPIIETNNLIAKDMGKYTFVKDTDESVQADYTFIYHKLEGKVLISLHHSSLVWTP